MVSVNFIRSEKLKDEVASKQRAQRLVLGCVVIACEVLCDGLMRWDEARCVEEQELLSGALASAQEAQRQLSLGKNERELSDREAQEWARIQETTFNAGATLTSITNSFPSSATLSELFLDAHQIRLKAIGTTGAESSRLVPSLKQLFPMAHVQHSGLAQQEATPYEEFVIRIEEWIAP